MELHLRYFRVITVCFRTFFQGREMRVLALGLICAVLGGCASLSKKQCLNADWQTIGFEDGTRGILEQRIGDHRKACAEYGVTPDLKLYRLGHEQGLKSFCTPHNGFQRGQNGSSYNGVCPPELEESFLVGFRAGRELHQVSREISHMERDIASAEKRLNELNNKIVQKEKELIQKGNTEQFRKRTYTQIKQLESELVETQRDLELMYSNQNAAEDSLAFLRDKYSHYIY